MKRGRSFSQSMLWASNSGPSTQACFLRSWSSLWMGTIEDHAHHPDLKIGRRSVSACHSESVNDQEVDIPVPQGFPGMFREFLPNLSRILTGLHDERSPFYQTIKRIGVFKNLMIRRNNDFNLLQLGVGNFYQFWTEGQVEVGRSPAFFGAVLGCRFSPNIS